MSFVTKNIRWIMLVSGALTCSMFYGLFAPQAALQSMFGVSFTGPLESIIVRSWSALVGLIGAVLIYGAFSEKNRVFAISVAAVSKAIFVSLILSHGREFLGKVAPVIVMDSLTVLLAALFLIVAWRQRSAV